MWCCPCLPNIITTRCSSCHPGNHPLTQPPTHPTTQSPTHPHTHPSIRPPADTAGSGNAGNRSCSSLAFENEDALRTYALATARHFNADAQLLAWAGAGLNVPVRRCAGQAGRSTHHPHTASCCGGLDTPAGPAMDAVNRACCPHPLCRHAGGRLLSAAEREIVSPLMAELFTRADALTAATQANLQSFIPQVGAWEQQRLVRADGFGLILHASGQMFARRVLPTCCPGSFVSAASVLGSSACLPPCAPAPPLQIVVLAAGTVSGSRAAAAQQPAFILAPPALAGLLVTGGHLLQQCPCWLQRSRALISLCRTATE